MISITRVLVLFFAIFYTHAHSQQTITGTFAGLAGQQVKLAGFEGFHTYLIDSATANENGRFQISFTDRDHGMGLLEAEDGRAFIVILAPGENLMLEGESLAFPETVVITSGNQNRLFEQYAGEHPRREHALSA